MSAAIEVTIQRLLAVEAVTAIVGQDINPDTAGAGVPSIALDLVSDTPWEALGKSTGTSRARVTVKLRSASYPVMAELAAAAHGALNRTKAVVRGRRCSWQKAGPDITRWSDDASVCEQLTDWYVTYGPEA